MTAPDTNVEKQARRHSPSLWGMLIVGFIVVLAVVALAIWSGVLSGQQAAPQTALLLEAAR